MENIQLYTIIKWLKRISAVTAVGIWLYAILIFIQDPAPFEELVPYCMGSTMLIFGILSGIFKGLETWEAKLKERGPFT
jgi:peptidoglycan/LPS O-acetylase OafA/YrhL